MYASHYHHLDGFLNLVLARSHLQILFHHVARLGAGITGSILHSIVRLPAVIFRWGIASLVFSLRVGIIFAES